MLTNGLIISNLKGIKMSKRKEAEDFILKYIGKILPDDTNVTMYKILFASMDDKAFEEFITDLGKGTKSLAVVSPNMAKVKLEVKRNLEIAKELGHNFFERIWIDNKNDIPPYLTPIPYMVVKLPLRRQAQLLVKKISIPEDNRSIDDFTGQPTGKSKGSKISYPEMQILSALNLEKSTTELMKYRGGDVKGFNAMNDSISKTGGVKLASLSTLGTKVKSTQTLSTLLTAMHLKNTGL
jgi:hypothetical protein